MLADDTNAGEHLLPLHSKDDKEGAHAVGYNNSSICVCLAGNFDATLPNDAQVNALRTLLQQKMKQWAIPLANITSLGRYGDVLRPKAVGRLGAH